MNLPHSLVLYVDDERRNLQTFRLAFKEQFRVVTASTPAEALSILAREPVAVLITDQRMPEMTGAELCAEVRRRFPDVVRMIVTAYSEIAAIMDAINRGEVSRYFIKPWREEVLADAIRAGIEAFQITTLARDLQVRLLQQQQQSTTSYLLGKVLHEIVSPAASIRDNLSFLVDSVNQLAKMAEAGSPELPRVAAELSPAFQDAYGSAQELVERIERFRRGEPAVREDAPGTSLERAVLAAASIVRTRVKERARLVLDTTAKAFVRADPAQLSQIIVNLVLNAYEAIAPGNPDQNQIVVSTVIRGDRCGLAVEDTGGGITPELRERIFEPFTSTKGQNRGLGLAIVRDIVEALGGTIELSQATRGVTFYVDLPRSG